MEGDGAGFGQGPRHQKQEGPRGWSSGDLETVDGTDVKAPGLAPEQSDAEQHEEIRSPDDNETLSCNRGRGFPTSNRDQPVQEHSQYLPEQKENDQVVSHLFNQPGYSDNYSSIAAWLYYGTDACFLQDADNLIMKTKDLVEILKFLREKFPQVSRVTTYSRNSYP